jgi:hypothetical protein
LDIQLPPEARWQRDVSKGRNTQYRGQGPAKLFVIEAVFGFYGLAFHITSLVLEFSVSHIMVRKPVSAAVGF